MAALFEDIATSYVELGLGEDIATSYFEIGLSFLWLEGYKLADLFEDIATSYVEVGPRRINRN